MDVFCILLFLQSFCLHFYIFSVRYFFLCFRFSSDGKLLVVSSEEKSVDFYTLKPQMKRVGYCKNIPDAVNQLDLSSDAKHVQVSLLPTSVIHSNYQHLYTANPSL